jgi:ABC-2 type transport system ATP-binding protein
MAGVLREQIYYAACEETRTRRRRLVAIHQDLIVHTQFPEKIIIDARKDAVVIDHVSKDFKKEQSWLRHISRKQEHRGRIVRAIDDISLTIKRREIFGVLGANGSGKSTLIRMLSTLLIPDSGSLSIFGYDVVKNERVVQRMINRVSVEASFFKKLSPLENLLYAARLYNMSGAEARQKIYSILTRLGIKRDRIQAPLENMSRGMQQKVAIARAFLTSPIVLLLDEPTTGLDPRSKIDVQNFIKELREQHDATILITTHDMEEADILCDRVAIIDQGAIVAMGETDELKQEIARLKGLDQTVSMNDVFMHYTASHRITEGDVKRYGSWEKAFEALEAQREEEDGTD